MRVTLGHLILAGLMSVSSTRAGEFAAAGEADLSSAVLLTPDNMEPRQRKAAAMLLDEVERRSGIRWPEMHAWPAEGQTVVALGLATALSAFPAAATAVNTEPEGYTIRSGKGVVVVAGNDTRGVLFGAGGLLREMRMSRGRITANEGLDIVSAPQYPLRGHQLGYRPKVNTYDGWTPEMYEQYIRDLAVFGANAIELIPPRSDDAPDSPHFVLPQIEMIARVSQLADDYGIDFWMWYPAMGVDYDKPETVAAALEEWAAVLSQLPRVDAIFVPSGDPGRLDPGSLYAFLEQASPVVRGVHPNVELWVSTQSFRIEQHNEFLELIRTRLPDFLDGIVFGPQNRTSLRELREALPPQYPIRHYPDITHSIKCQFPVPDWDPAYKLTEQREVINPRPTDFANIIRMYDDDTIGFLTYSEGCNDDVNKTVWSALGWNPDTPVIEILREYARCFIGPEFEDSYSQGLLALERNWRGPLLTNRGVFTTLAQFQDMERAATPPQLLNWRFQQGLYRAYYDAYTARRLAYETELEAQAMDALRRAPELGATLAMTRAEAILDLAVLEPVAQDLRGRVFELAEALYQSARMQLSVPRYRAIDVGRGANLDLIDTPLNDRLWLKARFAEIRQARPQEQLRQLNEIVNWCNPGPGGFYDRLGSLSQQPHLVREPGAEVDPEYREAPLLGVDYRPGQRMSWVTYSETRYDAPLRLRYDDLDANAQYIVRIVYAGDNMEAKIRLIANDGIEIHPCIAKPIPIAPVEFELPREATRSGSLTLSWTQEPGSRGGGRGCQIAEVWLVKKGD